MASKLAKRPRVGESQTKPPKGVKRVKRQPEYHSSSEDEPTGPADFDPVSLDSSDEDDRNSPTSVDRLDADTGTPSNLNDPGAEITDGMDSDNSSAASGSGMSATAATTKRKRNDPSAFATSMSKILSSKLSTSKRSDPVLSRSRDAAVAEKEIKDTKLETKAKQQLRGEKKLALERGRVRDVMGLEDAGTSTAALLEQEKRLRKTAQRGVVKLFNAVRAAQVKGEEAARGARQEGVVGMVKREEKVVEMSKKGFLDLIAGGGKKAGTAAAPS